jgi:hypothetical protein
MRIGRISRMRKGMIIQLGSQPSIKLSALYPPNPLYPRSKMSPIRTARLASAQCPNAAFLLYFGFAADNNSQPGCV